MSAGWIHWLDISVAVIDFDVGRRGWWLVTVRASGQCVTMLMVLDTDTFQCSLQAASEDRSSVILLSLHGHFICYITDSTSCPGDHREKEDMYDEIIHLKKVSYLFH